MAAEGVGLHRFVSRIANAQERVFDHLALLKPRVMSLVVFTGGVGFVLPPGRIDWLAFAITLVAMAAGAGACGALNMWYDADIDARMARTAARPIPRGTVEAREALVLGSLLSVVSVGALGFLVNWTAAALLAATIGIYVFVYTIWLKRRTPQNIVIGGAAGALPPVVGWAAATGSVAPGALALFLVIFLWTPPHFWALALCRSGDYERVGVPMLPVVAGIEETCRQILLYSLLLLPAALAPLATGGLGYFYAVVAAAGAAVMIQRAVVLYRLRRAPQEPMRKAAMRLFEFSILYMAALYTAMLVEVVAR